jgi:two-component system CheB/CheR fusion protein
MQSTNEELTTVNDELHLRMNELQIAYDDLHNLMTGADSAVLITGMDMRIRRYTHAAQKVLGLVTDDVGRPIDQLNAFFGGLRLEHAVADVVQTLTPFRREVQCLDGRWRSVHVTPYKTLEHSIKGAVIVCSDIDIRHRALRLAHAVSEYATRGLGTVKQPVLVVDAQTRVIWVNQLYLEAFQVTPEETVGNLVSTLHDGSWSDPAFQKLLDAAVASGASFRDHLVRRVSPDVGEKAYAVSGSRVLVDRAEPTTILLTFVQHAAPGPLH